MEVTKENVDKALNKILENYNINDLNKDMMKVQEYTQMVEDIMKDNPDATLDEVCNIFEEQQEMLANKAQEEQKEDTEMEQ